MKISNGKKQLAKIISENGGWIAPSNLAVYGKTTGRCYLLNTEEWPVYNATIKGFFVNASDVVSEFPAKSFNNWHQTIISRDEYFHLYPAPDADGWIEWKGGACPVKKGVLVDARYRNGKENIGVTALLHQEDDGFASARESGDYDLAVDWSIDGSDGDIVAYRLHKQEHPASIEPTIEQLAADYRAKLAIAHQAQEEADAANREADVALGKLERAGAALGLALSVAAPEPKLVVADWRDLRVGDVVWVGGVDDRIGAKLPDGEYEIAGLNEECDPEQPFSIEYGGLIWWPAITKRKW